MEVKPGVFSIMQENELRLDNRENHIKTVFWRRFSKMECLQNMSDLYRD